MFSTKFAKEINWYLLCGW